MGREGYQQLINSKKGLVETRSQYLADPDYFSVEDIHEIENLCNIAATALGQEVPFPTPYVIA